jgi:dTDP-4-amino-4,6-dideoxygalactose transaminase
MGIPFVDLRSQYTQLKGEIDAAVMQVLSDTAFIGGRYAANFEKAFAEYLGIENCTAVANGTDALEIALTAIGIGAGDEVLVPANTFIATAEGVSNVGAVPVFVDCDPNSYNIDTEKIEAKITARTKAITAVHLYGLPADMDAIMAIARKHNIAVLEDAAQAHGAMYKGKKAGTFGDIATFSFYPSKNLGAFGDAGAIVTNNSGYAEKARLIANHGQLSKGRHTLIGRNSRMDGIQAAVLATKLPYLDSWIEARRSHARSYTELLSASGLVIPSESPDSVHTYHLYVVQVAGREEVKAKLEEAGIETGIHYPIAPPFTEAYAHLNYTANDFPVTHSQMDRLFSLPMYPELTVEMIEEVCQVLKNAVAKSATASE